MRAGAEVAGPGWRETTGSPSVAAESGEVWASVEGVRAPGPAGLGGRDSQKAASRLPAVRAVGSGPAKARHSAWQAGVMSSPDQEAGMRWPVLVQPGHEPRWAWYFRGHSKG